MEGEGLWGKIKSLSNKKSVRTGTAIGALIGGAEIMAGKIAESQIPEVEPAHIDTTPVEGGSADAAKRLPPELKNNLFKSTGGDNETSEADAEDEETGDEPTDDLETDRQLLIKAITEEYKKAKPDQVVTREELEKAESKIYDSGLSVEEAQDAEVKLRMGKIIIEPPNDKGVVAVRIRNSDKSYGQMMPYLVIPNPEDGTVTLREFNRILAEHIEPWRLPRAIDEAIEMYYETQSKFTELRESENETDKNIPQDEIEKLKTDYEAELKRGMGEIESENK